MSFLRHSQSPQHKDLSSKQGLIPTLQHVPPSTPETAGHTRHVLDGDTPVNQDVLAVLTTVVQVLNSGVTCTAHEALSRLAERL